MKKKIKRVVESEETICDCCYKPIKGYPAPLGLFEQDARIDYAYCSSLVAQIRFSLINPTPKQLKHMPDICKECYISYLNGAIMEMRKLKKE